MVSYGLRFKDKSAKYLRDESYRLTGRVFAASPIGGDDPAEIGISQAGKVYRLLELFPVRQSKETKATKASLTTRQSSRLADTCRRIESRCNALDAKSLEQHKFYHLCKIQLRQLQAEQVTRQRKPKPVESTGPYRQTEQRSTVEWTAMPLGLRLALSEITGAAGKPVSEAYRLEIAAYAIVEMERIQQVADRMESKGKDSSEYLAKATYPVIVKRARSAYRSDRSGRMSTTSHSVESCVVFCPESELAAIHSRRLLATVASEPSKSEYRLCILRQHVDRKAIELMARGITQVEICKQLGISERTLRNQLAAARKAFADLPVPALLVE